MSELTLTLLRLGYLALLWLLVLSVVAVLRRDLFGTTVSKRATAGGGGRAANPPPAPAAPRAKGDDDRNTPRTLVVTEGSLKGTTIRLGQAPVLIGRSPECNLVLDDDFASGRHAKLSPQAGVWTLEDLGSTNGTFLGRKKVEVPTALGPGSSIRIGRTVIELRR